MIWLERRLGESESTAETTHSEDQGNGDAIARAIYVTVRERRIVILHAFRKKTRKTPKAAIRTALSRMKELDP